MCDADDVIFIFLVDVLPYSSSKERQYSVISRAEAE